MLMLMLMMVGDTTTLAEAKSTTLHIGFELGRAGFFAERVVVDCYLCIRMKGFDKSMFSSDSRRTRTASTSVGQR
jgi:hypothetical protein